MLLEIIGHLYALDLGWFIGLATNSVMITFMLFAVFFIFLEGKKVLKGSIVIFITLFAFLDFEKVIGIPLFVGGTLLIYYITKIAVLALVENNKYLKKYLIFINELQMYGSFILSIIILG
ncbi:MAG: hypothetical protein ABID38_00380 [Candidatus Diapherotrites archaeon]